MNVGPARTGQSQNAILHFAYGANMSLEILQRKRGLTPLSSQPAQVTDPHVKLAFQHRGGFATLILPKVPVNTAQNSRNFLHPESTALEAVRPHGILYSLTPEDMRVLQRAETGYQLVDVRVTPYPSIIKSQPAELSTAGSDSVQPSNDSPAGLDYADPLTSVGVSGSSDSSLTSPPIVDEFGDSESIVIATAFVSKPMLRLRLAVPPTDRYLSLLQSGAREQGICRAYCEWLANVPSVSRSGLPAEYFDTPSGLVANLILITMITALIVTLTLQRL